MFNSHASYGAATPYFRDSGIDELFRQMVRHDPAQTAVEFGTQRWSYAELDGLAERWSSLLQASGLALEQTVGVLLESGFDQILIQVAILRAGGTCVPMDPALPDVRIAALLSSLGITHVVTNRASRTRLAPTHLYCVEDTPDVDPRFGPRGVPGDHRTHILHTSGSTGRPKGVEVLARGISRIALNRTLAPLGPDDRIAHISSPSFDASLFDIWGGLLTGATVVVLPKQTIIDPFALRDSLQRHGITAMFITTALFNLTAQACPDAFRGLRHLLTGGEAANVHAFREVLLHSMPQNFRNVYGPTECTIFATSMVVTPESLPTQGPVSIGQALDHTQAYILDEHHHPAEEGEQGELYLGGDGLARGYYDQPEQTAERFVSLPVLPGRTPQRLYRTGDLARWKRDGNIEFLGRVDRQIKLRGYRIELEEIEVAVLASGMASGVIVELVRPAEADPYLVGYIVLSGGGDGQLSALREHLRQHLPDYMQPRLHSVGHIPVNANGKVDRPALRQALENTVSRNDPDAADALVSSPQQKALASLWCQLLDLGAVVPADDFFALGGSSLQAAALIVAMERQFHQRVSIKVLYEHPTLAALAGYLQSNQTDRVPLQVADSLAALRADATLAQFITVQPGEAIDWKQPGEGRVLLTGATGFLGAFFLRDLLRQPFVDGITCLVRAANAAEGLKRIQNNMRNYGLWDDAWLPRLRVVTGDLSDPCLGQGEAGFDELARWASVVFHLGAHVNYTQPYATHRPANVLGTLHVLKLARAVRPVSLHYVSSIAAYGPTGYFTGTTELAEDTSLDPHLQSLKYDTGYSQSQWSAEQLVRTAQSNGMPIAIYRPGFIIGDSERGFGNEKDFVARLIRGCIQIGAYPRLIQQSKEFVMVDYVSAALLTIAGDVANLGTAYNLVPLAKGQSPDLMGLFTLLNDAGFSLNELPYRDWVERLENDRNLDGNPLLPLLPMLAEPVYGSLTRWEVYQHMPVYRTDNVRRVLAGRVACPVLDVDLLKRHLRSWHLLPPTEVGEWGDGVLARDVAPLHEQGHSVCLISSCSRVERLDDVDDRKTDASLR
ncbi:amino acid adenylation domain-containing protein [Rhodanobacter sp. Col0626]|uniref:amino acid adenylation domain-containing protein n=1 Tax=Rhodanobacter sp. Col0626 TaxID=3415679 RepID=UPI003CF85E67